MRARRASRLVANGEAADWVNYYANYTYTRSEDLATGNPLSRVPRHKVNMECR